MKVALFTSGGEFGLSALRALAEGHDVTAVIQPGRRSLLRRIAGAAARLAGFKRTDPVARWARHSGLPLVRVSREGLRTVEQELDRLKPDVICIASFPWLLPPGLLAIPKLGVLNLHPSLLPRHRGPNPLFWTYYHDDRETGITVHLATVLADSGPVLLQKKLPLPRGIPVAELYDALSRVGGPALREAVDLVGSGTARMVDQSDDRVTAAPRVPRTSAMVPFDVWDVERVWHFLAGLNGKFRESLRCEGRSVIYRGVLGFVPGSSGATPGTVTSAAHGWDLHCLGGFIRLHSRGDGSQ